MYLIFYRWDESPCIRIAEIIIVIIINCMMSWKNGGKQCIYRRWEGGL